MIQLIIKPPDSINSVLEYPHANVVFLAGTIEQGQSIDWQAEATKSLPNCVIFNPRREVWDSSWIQSIDNPLFVEQVEWELDALEVCDKILMYFAPGTRSPISLLEFGLYAKSGKLIVVCPEGFWRKGNVDITCRKYNIQQFPSINEACVYISTLKG